MAGEAIFISYRRGDAAGSARALFQELCRCFGAEQVFYDQAGIDPGEHFPARLRTAIQGARVTLAVIGPTWLAELNRRHREQPQELDVVRDEIRLALELQQSQPAIRHVIPVLMECESMPPLAQLDAALLPDLGALWQHDARSLAGKHLRWEVEVNALLRYLRQVLQPAPQPSADDAARIASARDVIGALLAVPSMQPLRDRWGADPLSAFEIDKLQQAVKRYAQSIMAAVPDWRSRRLDTDTLVQVRQTCRDVLSALYALAVDGSTARAWLEKPDARHPVPVASIGALAFAYAQAQGKKAQMADSSADRASFEPEDALDLGAPDPGGTQRRSAMVHKRFWQNVFTDPRVEYPSGERPLSGDDLDILKDRLAAFTDIHDRAPFVSELQGSGGAESDLKLIADELGIAALPRTGVDQGLLRVDERRFNAYIAETLACIKKIQ